MDAWLQRVWYRRSALTQAWAWLLSPLALLFWLSSATRRCLYRLGALRSVTLAKPVIVVGNLTVGGTGKTPLVIWLTKALRERGYTPAAITRGYGGVSTQWPLHVAADSDPELAGDEAVLIAKQTGALVIAGPDRVADGQKAIELGADVVISDDGLQHYRLVRQFEIVVVDAVREFGNGRLLPAGPLREGVSRLNSVDAVVATLRDDRELSENLASLKPFVATSQLHMAVRLATGEEHSLDAFRGRRIHAIAGIGHPESFFDGLRRAGIDVDSHAIPDHAQITPDNIAFADTLPVFMTDKDAVKCRSFADHRLYAVSQSVQVGDAERLLNSIATKLDASK